MGELWGEPKDPQVPWQQRLGVWLHHQLAGLDREPGCGCGCFAVLLAVAIVGGIVLLLR